MAKIQSNKNKTKKRKYLVENLVGYNGKKKIIDTRSNWESIIVNKLQLLYKFNRIKGWNSEECVFKYKKTIDNGFVHRYFMDFCVFKEKIINNVIHKKIIFVEVKPMHECVKPKYSKNMTDKQKLSYKKAMDTYITNQDKWTAVEEWCKQKNNNTCNVDYSFQIWCQKPKTPYEIKNFVYNSKYFNFKTCAVINT